ncbi:MAG TPA: PA14 domain-containing protein [Paludibacter sp.]
MNKFIYCLTACFFIFFVNISALEKEDLTSYVNPMSCNHFKSGKIVIYKTIPNAIKSETFKVTANGQELFTEHYKATNLAQFASEGTVNLTIEASQPIYKYRIFPERYGIQAKLEGDKMQITIPESPVQLIITINNLERLIVYSDVPEKDKPTLEQANVVSLKAFGIDSTGTENVTAKLQHAIDSLATCTEKKILFVPTGIYKCSNIIVPSNIDIYLEDGSLLLGTGVVADYTDLIARKDTAQFVKDLYDYVAIGQLSMMNATNSRIYGRGTVDAQGDILWDKNNRANMLHVFYTYNCKNIRVEGINLRNSYGWTTVMETTHDAVFDNVKVLTVPHHEMADGFDVIGGCSDITLLNCFAYCNDDPFALNNITSTRDFEVKNITVKNFIGWNPRANSIRLGFWMWANTENLYFENMDFGYANKSALVIHPPRWNDYNGITVNPVYKNIQFKNCNFEDCGRLCGLLFDCSIACDSVKFINCTFDAEKSSIVSGCEKDGHIGKVVFENLVIAGKAISTAAQGNILDTTLVDNITFSNKQPVKKASKQTEMATAPVLEIDSANNELKIKVTGPVGYEIRYTTDETEPMSNSEIYTNAISISKDKVFKAKCFKAGLMPSWVAECNLKQTYLAATANKSDKAGLHYNYYEGFWELMPDYSKLHAIKEGTVSNVNYLDMLKTRQKTDGYGMLYTGYLNVPVEGPYTFNIASDDGSKLYIDGKLIVDNDGVHAQVEKESIAYLKSGKHVFRLEYFEKVGGEAFNLLIGLGNSELQSIPNIWLSN